MSVLRVENLSIQFHGKANPTVQDISFTLERGKTTAIVGESGSGKSLTALSLLGLNHTAFHPTGDIFYEEQSLLTQPQWQKIRGKHITMVFQEPMTALNPLHSLRKQLRETIMLHQPTFTKEQCNARIEELCHEVELGYLKERLHNYPHQLSGGERQRMMIAMAIANNPDILIADEPTTALDVSTQAKIMELLRHLQQKYNMAILLITHDLHLVKEYASHVIVMQQGRIMEAAPTQQIFSAPHHPYTQELLAAIHTGEPAPLPAHAPLLLACDKLEVYYHKQQGFFSKKQASQALAPTNFTLKQGETLGVVGESGSGKTSLGLALARLIPSQGNIVFQGRELHRFTAKELRHARSKLQFVFQDPFSSLNPRMNIEQIVTEGLHVHCPDLTAQQRSDRLEKTLLSVGLDMSMRDRHPHEFSGGQRQRINIARAMILRPACIIFDEPTSALDITLQTQIIHLLKNLQRDHHTSYIFISHDIRSIRNISHQLLVLQQGKVVEYGLANDVLQHPQHPYTQMLIQAAQY
jgi:microcin C transport system ATP-binding protein